ncbi:unknown [Clostridium sp. CAG:609]|nr:unknown [Clostridium sp. CAG:609]
MFKFLKRNLFIIVFIIVVFGYVFNGISKSVNEFQQIDKRKENIALKCETDLSDENNSYSDNYIKYCENILSYKDDKFSFYNYLSDMAIEKCGLVVGYLGLLVVLVPALYYVCRLLKNGYIVNYLTRKNYLSFLKCLFGKAYRFVWILPLIAIIMICVSLKYGVIQNNTNTLTLWMSDITNNIYLFIILYLINVFMYSCMFINFGLIVARYQNNYFLSLVLSYIIFFGLELFLELFSASGVCNVFFKDYCGGSFFNIMDAFTFNDAYGVSSLMLFSFVMLVISFVGVFLAYRNQEKLVIKSERYWRSK